MLRGFRNLFGQRSSRHRGNHVINRSLNFLGHKVSVFMGFDINRGMDGLRINIDNWKWEFPATSCVYNTLMAIAPELRWEKIMAVVVFLIAL